MFGNGSFHEFYEKNKWAKTFLPNKNISERIHNLLPVNKPIITKIIEKILTSKLGDSIDNFFLRITYNKWKTKFKNIDKDQFDIALKSTKNVSKHHPLNFQNHVIERLNKKYVEYQENYNIYLPKEHA